MSIGSSVLAQLRVTRVVTNIHIDLVYGTSVMKCTKPRPAISSRPHHGNSTRNSVVPIPPGLEYLVGVTVFPLIYCLGFAPVTISL